MNPSLIIERIKAVKKQFSQLLQETAVPLVGVDSQNNNQIYQIYNCQKYLTVVYVKMAVYVEQNQYTSMNQKPSTIEEVIVALIKVYKIMDILIWNQKTQGVGTRQYLQTQIDACLGINTVQIVQIIDSNIISKYLKDTTESQRMQMQYLSQLSDFVSILTGNLTEFTVKECVITMLPVMQRLTSIVILLQNKEYAKQFFGVLSKKTENNIVYEMFANFYRSFILLHLNLIAALHSGFQKSCDAKQNMYYGKYLFFKSNGFFRLDISERINSLKQFGKLEDTDQLSRWGITSNSTEQIKLTQVPIRQTKKSFVDQLQEHVTLKKLNYHNQKILFNFKRVMQAAQQFEKENQILLQFDGLHHRQAERMHKSAFQTSMKLLRLGKIVLPQNIDWKESLTIKKKSSQIAQIYEDILAAKIYCKKMPVEEFHCINYLSSSNPYLQFSGQQLQYLLYTNLIGVQDQKQKNVSKQVSALSMCYPPQYQNFVEKVAGQQEYYPIKIKDAPIVTQLKVFPFEVQQIQTVVLRNWPQIKKTYQMKHTKRSIVQAILKVLLTQYASKNNTDYANLIKSQELKDLIKKQLQYSQINLTNSGKIQVNTEDWKKVINQLMALTVQRGQIKEQVKIMNDIKNKQLAEMMKRKEMILDLINKMKNKPEKEAVLQNKLRQQIDRMIQLPKRVQQRAANQNETISKLSAAAQNLRIQILKVQKQRDQIDAKNQQNMARLLQQHDQKVSLLQKNAQYVQRQKMENQNLNKMIEFTGKFAQDPLFTLEQKKKLSKILSSLLKVNQRDPLEALKNIFHFMAQVGNEGYFAQKIQKLALGNLSSYTTAQLQADRKLSNAFSTKFLTIFEDLGIFKQLKILSSRYQGNLALIKFYATTGRYNQISFLQNQNSAIKSWFSKIEDVYKKFLKQTIEGNHKEIQEAQSLLLENPKQYFLKILTLPKINMKWGEMMSKFDTLRKNLQNMVDVWNQKESKFMKHDEAFIDEMYKQVDQHLEKNDSVNLYTLIKEKIAANFVKFKNMEQAKRKMEEQKKYAKCLIDHYLYTFAQLWKTSQVVQKLINFASTHQGVASSPTLIDFFKKTAELFQRNVLKHGFMLIECKNSNVYAQAKTLVQQASKGVESSFQGNSSVMQALEYIKKIEALSKQEIQTKIKQGKFAI